LEFQPQPAPLPQPDTYPGALGSPLSDYIAELWERNALGFVGMNVQNRLYYRFATCQEYKDIQCWIEQKSMKTYYDNKLKEENTALHFLSFKNQDGFQKLVASMPDDLALGEWELHTLKDMKWNDNHQRPMKYWGGDMLRGMRRFMQQPAYAEYPI